MSPSDRRASQPLWRAREHVDGSEDAADGEATAAVPEPAIDGSAWAVPDIVPATSDDPEPEPDPVIRTVAEPDRTEPLARTAPITPPTAAPTLAPAVRSPSARPADAWDEHLRTMRVPAQPGQPLRHPGRRPRVRRVTRVLRHIDPWSTFKVALIFSAVAYVVFLTAGVLLWRVADNTGTLDNVQRWFTQFGWETFEFDGSEIFHNAWIIGLFGVVATTGGFVLLVTLFNLVSDIVGGVRLTVLEEEVVERTMSSNRRYVVRRPPVTDAEASADWDVDGEPPPAPAPAAADWSVDDDDDPGAERPGRSWAG